VFMGTVIAWRLPVSVNAQDPDEELRPIVRADRPQPGPGRWPRPPRGWDTHSA